MCNKRPKFLYFTFITPSEKFGGGLAVIQSLFSLSKIADVDYVGPEFDAKEFEKYGIKLTLSYILSKKNNNILRACRLLLRGISTSFYDSWKKIIDQLDSKKYDCCYLDFTRQSFVVNWAKQKKLPIIVRAHNVETDYFEDLYHKNKTIINYLHKIFGKRSEKKCVQNANKVLVLTNHDKNRFIELFGNRNNIELFPICVKYFDALIKMNLPEYFILITGSLWFGPNASGTAWFLKNVWVQLPEDIKEKYALVIAGAKPNEEIQALCKGLKNVHLYSNPESIDAFYQQASLYIAPIFHGAGMKVKIAEALSCGVPIIATKHAFVGYEAAGNVINICDSVFEFIESIKNILNMSCENRKNLQVCILEVFENNYSLSQSSKIMKKIIEKMINKE